MADHVISREMHATTNASSTIFPADLLQLLLNDLEENNKDGICNKLVELKNSTIGYPGRKYQIVDAGLLPALGRILSTSADPAIIKEAAVLITSISFKSEDQEIWTSKAMAELTAVVHVILSTLETCPSAREQVYLYRALATILKFHPQTRCLTLVNLTFGEGC